MLLLPLFRPDDWDNCEICKKLVHDNDLPKEVRHTRICAKCFEDFAECQTCWHIVNRWEFDEDTEKCSECYDEIDWGYERWLNEWDRRVKEIKEQS